MGAGNNGGELAVTPVMPARAVARVPRPHGAAGAAGHGAGSRAAGAGSRGAVGGAEAVAAAVVTTAAAARALRAARSRPVPRAALGAARALAAGRIAAGVVQAVAPHAASRLLPARPAGAGDSSALARGLGVRDTVVAAGWWHALDRGRGAAEWAWLHVASDLADSAGTVGRWRALDRREKAWMVVLGVLTVADTAVAVALGGEEGD